jgi:hypothetical protein
LVRHDCGGGKCYRSILGVLWSRLWRAMAEAWESFKMQAEDVTLCPTRLSIRFARCITGPLPLISLHPFTTPTLSHIFWPFSRHGCLHESCPIQEACKHAQCRQGCTRHPLHQEQVSDTGLLVLGLPLLSDLIRTLRHLHNILHPGQQFHES